MTYEDIRKIALENKARKQANDIQEKINRSRELMNQLVSNLQAKQANEQLPRPTTACQRALRRHLMAQKAASDPRTPVQRVKDLLDAKAASDPALRAMRIIGEARAAKEAAEVKQQQARTVKLEQAVHSQAPFEKPLEGQENKDEGRSVTFSDGRTVNFPAANTTPVKSASERIRELICKKAQENAAQPPVEPVQKTPVAPTPAPAPVPAAPVPPAPARPKPSMWELIGQGASAIQTGKQVVEGVNNRLSPEQKRRIAQGVGGLLNKGQQIVQNHQVQEKDQRGKQAVVNGIGTVRDKVNQWGGVSPVNK